MATVSADGPHVLRRNGSELEISSDGEFGASIDGFQLLKATRSLDDFRSLGLGKELLLRVNPSLLVDIRAVDEHARERIPGACCIPLARLASAPQRQLAPGRTILLHCRSGMRTGANAAALEAAAPAAPLRGRRWPGRMEAGRPAGGP